MCQNFDSLRNVCEILNIITEAKNTEQAIICEEQGNFIRNLNVIPDSFNLFESPEDVPEGWQPDLSKLPKDDKGRPLYTITNRGYERAIPAYDGIELKANDFFNMVPRYTTYQGQRELIYELGYELAKKVVEEKGYKLHVLPGEEKSIGIDKYKSQYINKQGRNRPRVLLADEPIEAWD